MQVPLLVSARDNIGSVRYYVLDELTGRLLGTWALGLLGSWALGLLSSWALGHLDVWLMGTWALGHLGSWSLGLLGNCALGVLGSRSLGLLAHGHLGSWALGLLVTWALGHLGSWALGLLSTWALGLLVTWALGHLDSWALGLLGSWTVGLSVFRNNRRILHSRWPSRWNSWHIMVIQIIGVLINRINRFINCIIVGCCSHCIIATYEVRYQSLCNFRTQRPPTSSPLYIENEE
jgi:hypothetical protein